MENAGSGGKHWMWKRRGVAENTGSQCKQLQLDLSDYHGETLFHPTMNFPH